MCFIPPLTLIDTEGKVKMPGPADSSVALSGSEDSRVDRQWSAGFPRQNMTF